MSVSVVKAWKKRWKTIAILASIGIAVFFVARNKQGTSGVLFASDMFFAVSMAFFCWGLLCLVRNMGVFDSVVYDMKHMVRLLRGHWESSQEKKDGYLEYVRARPRRTEVPVMMLLSGAFVVVSAVLSLFAG